jgi:hypothetical protein
MRLFIASIKALYTRTLIAIRLTSNMATQLVSYSVPGKIVPFYIV